MVAQRVKAIKGLRLGSSSLPEIILTQQGRLTSQSEEQLLPRDIRDDLKVRQYLEAPRTDRRPRRRGRCSFDRREGTSPTEVKAEEARAEGRRQERWQRQRKASTALEQKYGHAPHVILRASMLPTCHGVAASHHVL